MANRLPTASVQPATRLVQPPCGVRILGLLEVVDAGSEVPLGGRNQRILLARLLVNADEVVSTDRIIDALWGEEPPRTALTSVQNSVARLRKRIGPERLVTKPPGYMLRLQDDVLDARRARRARRRGAGGRAAGPRGDPERGGAALAGPSLADFAYEASRRRRLRSSTSFGWEIVEERIETELELVGTPSFSASSRRWSPSTRSGSPSWAS